MRVRTRPRLPLAALPLCALVGFAASAMACRAAAPTESDAACVQYESLELQEYLDRPKMDLVLAIDDSPAMALTSLRIRAQLQDVISMLSDPPCISPTNVNPHRCVPGSDDVPYYPPVADLHVAVVSGDLGSGAVSVAGCSDASAGRVGDDGLFDPVDRGPAWRAYPPDATLRAACATAGTPTFLSFDSRHPSSTFAADAACQATLGANGCTAQQPLEALYRALVEHRADDRPDNTDPNAGFLRDDSLLLLLVVTAEDDASIRDCRHSESGIACEDAMDVFDPTSTRWAGSDLRSRLDRYAAGSPQDPTWPLDRYLDPSNANRGFDRLKPGHPERVLFAAITGVPISLPVTGTGAYHVIDWDALLGAAGPRGPNDFAGRDGSTALSTTSPEGPISMRPSNVDPGCPERVLPACRREATPNIATACTAEQQDFASPARRLVELARRFDQAPRCYGQPCQRGLVTSICRSDLTPAVMNAVQTMQCRLIGRMSAWDLVRSETDSSGFTTAPCRLLEIQPPGVACDPARARMPLPTWYHLDSPTFGTEHRDTCEIPQVPIDATGHPRAGGTGWYVNTVDDPGTCGPDDLGFTEGTEPVAGTMHRLSCVHERPQCGAPDAGADRW